MPQALGTGFLARRHSQHQVKNLPSDLLNGSLAIGDRSMIAIGRMRSPSLTKAVLTSL